MKVIIASLLLVLGLVFGAQAQTIAAYGTMVITNNHTTFTNIVSTNLLCTTFTFVGVKAGGVTNLSPMYLGPASNAVFQYVAPGDQITISAPRAGEKINLKNFWMKGGSANDGAWIIYQ